LGQTRRFVLGRDETAYAFFGHSFKDHGEVGGFSAGGEGRVCA
jgi:hypothetical protein